LESADPPGSRGRQFCLGTGRLGRERDPRGTQGPREWLGGIARLRYGYFSVRENCRAGLPMASWREHTLLRSTVAHDFSALNKWDAIKKMTEQILAPSPHAAAALAVAEAMMRREALGSMGIGGGVAVPHTKYVGVNDIYVGWFYLGNGIDWEALDDKPVYVIGCLVTPSERPGDHLRVLEFISRCVRRSGFVEEARAARDSDDWRARMHKLAEDDS
jgi:PTS system nitrogen regulatory IIA component